MHEHGYVQVEDGLRLYYGTVGTGPDTVVIPAATGLAADLEALARGRRLVFYDQRGRGRSDADPDGSHLWTDYEVRDLEAVRRHLSLERTSILGWSYMGGIIALYAADHPERVERLVLMCPIQPRSDAPYVDPEAVAEKERQRIDPQGARRLEEMRETGLAARHPEAYCREFQKVIMPRQMGRPEALARMRSDPCAVPNEWRHNMEEHLRKHIPPASRNWDWRHRVSAVRAPALVIHGGEDLIPIASSREWAATLADARLLLLPGVGHFPYLEAPEAYFAAVDRFLSGDWPKGAERVVRPADP